MSTTLQTAVLATSLVILPLVCDTGRRETITPVQIPDPQTEIVATVERIAVSTEQAVEQAAELAYTEAIRSYDQMTAKPKPLTCSESREP